MTKEELKEMYSMQSIVEQYGFRPNRAGFISCPFHKGDRDASMRIYKDSYYCFGCGESGDIFSFVQHMDGVEFKEAFLSLGGTYEKPTFQSKLAVYQANKQKEMRQKKVERLQWRKDLNIKMIDIYRYYMDKSEPMSDVWCDCYNALQYHLYVLEMLNRKEVAD